MAATYYFGVSATLTTNYGFLQNFKCTNSGETAEIKDEDGNTVAVHNYGEIMEATADLVWDTTVPAPTFSDILTTTGHADAGKFQVMSRGETQTNNGHNSVDVVLKRWVDNSLPA